MNKNGRAKVAVVCGERDFTYVKPVAGVIEKNGYNIWYYQEQITGYNSLNIIAENILASDIVIAFLSNNFLFSSWQKKAIDLAKMNKKRILLVFFDDYSFNKLPQELQTFYSDSFTINSSKNDNRIAEHVCSFLNTCFAMEESENRTIYEA